MASMNIYDIMIYTYSSQWIWPKKNKKESSVGWASDQKPKEIDPQNGTLTLREPQHLLKDLKRAEWRFAFGSESSASKEDSTNNEPSHEPTQTNYKSN